MASALLLDEERAVGGKPNVGILFVEDRANSHQRQDQFQKGKHQNGRNQ